jgi:hypothetical protein
MKQLEKAPAFLSIFQENAASFYSVRRVNEDLSRISKSRESAF